MEQESCYLIDMSASCVLVHQMNLYPCQYQLMCSSMFLTSLVILNYIFNINTIDESLC